MLAGLAGCGRLGFDPEPDGRSNVADSQGCPTSYAPLSTGLSHVYRPIPTALSWTMQMSTCAADGAYLAIPESPFELDTLVGVAGETWIGISDRATEGRFLTVFDTVPSFLPWQVGQPDDFMMNEDCVVATPSGLNDLPCNVLRPAICECGL